MARSEEQLDVLFDLGCLDHKASLSIEVSVRENGVIDSINIDKAHVTFQEEVGEEPFQFASHLHEQDWVTSCSQRSLTQDLVELQTIIDVLAIKSHELFNIENCKVLVSK